MITTEQKTNNEDGLGFHPGFPPGFDPKRAEQGLAQEDEVEGDLRANCECGHARMHHNGPDGRCVICLPRRCGQFREVDPPRPDEPTLEDALEHALTRHVEGAATRWLQLQRNGATDAELLARIADEFQGCGGSSQNGGWSVKGGKSPQFTWFDDGPLYKAQKLTGKRLLAKVREVLEIGAPGAPAVEIPLTDDGDDWETRELKAPIEYKAEAVAPKTRLRAKSAQKRATVEKVSQADKKRLHNEALARYRRGPETYVPQTEAPADLNGHHPQMLQMIPVNQIVPSPTNPRKFFDRDKLQELANSIETHGLIEPILVRPLHVFNGHSSFSNIVGYELVAGERRWRAAQLVPGTTTIEAKVRDLDDRAVLEIQLVENLQREDVSPVEEADGYSAMLALKREDGTSVYTVDSLAARIGKKGKSKSYVYSRLKLRNLPPAALEALAKGDLPATVGELIGRLPSMEMRQEFWDEEFEGYGSDWFQMPSFRDIKLEIERGYMRELKSAPFSQADKKLLPEAGSCKDCPKRTGNNRAEYPDGRADICTDLPCYDRKIEAFNQRKLAEAAQTDGVRVLSPEESEKWFGFTYLRPSSETRDYIDLNDECDQAADPEDWEKSTPTYAELLGDSVKVEVVGLDKGGQIHQLVSREAAEAVLKEKGIKISSPGQTEADRKAGQQKFKEEKSIRDQAANEICVRAIQSLTDNPFFVDSKVGNRDTGAFLRAIALHLVGDADIARCVNKQRAIHLSGGNRDHRVELHKRIADMPEQTALELIVEYMLVEELEWWIRSGQLPYPLKRFPISEYFGHDPKKIEKRIAKERAEAKKAKLKSKPQAVAQV